MNLRENTTSMSNCAHAVVATVHSPESLALARRVERCEVDFLELRVDAFARDSVALTELERTAPKLRLPLIVTVRHPREGGASALSARERRELFMRFLPHAAIIDVELRAARELDGVLGKARAQGVRTVLSHHDFQKTPTLEKLRVLATQARAAGADIFKVAALAQTPRDLATLLAFLTKEKSALAVMAMGERLGKISRLLFAQTGSVLNYGFLDRANAPGQWPAKLLKKRIAELTSA